MSRSLKPKQSIKGRRRASNRKNVVSDACANHTGEEDLRTLFGSCHALAPGETNSPPAPGKSFPFTTLRKRNATDGQSIFTSLRRV
jgi:hypothetical protein